MLKKIFQNARQPKGFWGRFFIRRMNRGHTPISRWALRLIAPAPDARALDIGCGGGINVERLLKRCPTGYVCGIDYSDESVALSQKRNAAALGTRCRIRKGDASSLPYKSGVFDVVTAFETVYFWPNLGRCFAEALRVLKSGGVMMVVNATENTTDTKWTGLIDGMRIYNGEELQALLSEAGFAEIAIHRHALGWVALTAKKP